MLTRCCRYQTSRLRVAEWHELEVELRLDLAKVVSAVLTPRTTAALPPSWHGDYSLERAESWMAERDAESATLLVLDSATDEAVGLVILFEGPAAKSDAYDVRLGYVLAERHWGQGFASELVAGLVDWAKSHRVASLSGGVEPDNVASARVLLKNGFARTETTPGGEELYVLDLFA